MNNKPALAGKKIAVIIESDFIPHELNAYETVFSELGAKVEFISRLWGQNSQTFQGHVDPLEKDKSLHYRTVYKDFQDVKVSNYAAILMAANYCSVRLRYFDANSSLTPTELVKSSPAVKFFAEAMASKCIVKGALCHGLWILTPMPELLKGRKVICHEVVLADVLNAGAIYAPSPSKIVVDQDLVTGYSADQAEDYAQRIAECITQKQKKKPSLKPLL